MSFGFSVGDVLVCSKLAINAYTALKDAPKEFEGLRLEVLSLSATLRALAEEANSPNSIILLASPQRQESLRVLLDNCSKGLQQLHLLTKKFPSLGSPEKTKFLEHVRFSLQNKNGPRDKLAIHTASINIFLTSLTHSSLGRLEGLIKNALRGSAQKQQGSQTQFASAGYTNHIVLGDRSQAFNVQTPDVGSVSAVGSEDDVWASIGQDLSWEGIRAQDVKPFRDEIITYIRYLHNGGEPFWKRGSSSSEQEAMRKGRVEEKSRPAAYTRDATPHQRPDSRHSYPVSQAPPAYTAHAPYPVSQQLPLQQPSAPNRSSTSTTPSAGSALWAYRPPSQQPTPEDADYSSDDDHLTSRPAQNSNDDSNSDDGLTVVSPPALKPVLRRKEGQTALPNNSNAPPNQQEYGKLLNPGSVNHTESEFESQHSTVNQPVEQPQPQQGAGSFVSQSPSSFFGAPSGGFGAPSSSTFTESSPFGNPQASTSESLFGGYAPPVTASTDVSVGKRASSTSSGLFGSKPATGETLFGSNKPSTNQTSVRYGDASHSQVPVLFGKPAVNENEINEMAELFDHMFDVDDADVVIAQGIDEPLRNSSLPADSVHEYTEPQHGRSNSIAPESRPPHLTFGPSPLDEQKIFYSASSGSPQSLFSGDPIYFRMPPPVRPTDPLESKRACLTRVKTQLEMQLRRLYDAQHTGDGTVIRMLLNPGPGARPSPIHERVAYLRAAGAIVVDCDICRTPVPDKHWHCGLCAGGDWDCCLDCRMKGQGCPGRHALAERSARRWGGRDYWTNL
ncbi:uncharacterized protein PV09_07044 [Verruconis gallopava]|uniref:Fungal N-terminal domain-containing protein n=1 Tax=Verruconis gallopava TaxID=253628 RepID=A0A0D2A513_9PEZI|nr:uncharacterized protein PV09_07044 [Verruconis gallopava]KIW01570.1 hypothetical protein PV09_07044 [Verruconis gallopava]